MKKQRKEHVQFIGKLKFCVNPYLLRHSGQPRHQVGYLAFHIFQYLLIPCQALRSALWNILSFISSKKTNLAQEYILMHPNWLKLNLYLIKVTKRPIYLFFFLSYNLKFRIFMYQSKISPTDNGMFSSLFWGLQLEKILQ